MTHHFRFVFNAALAFCLLAAPLSAETILVTNLNPTGAGSFQAALDAAAATEEPSIIMVTNRGGQIEITDGLLYDSASSLTVFGNGTTITSTENVTLLSALNATVLILVDIGFEGPGDWGLDNRGDLDGAAGNGIFVNVADGSAADLGVRLEDVTVGGVAGHGIHISDCVVSDDCGEDDTGSGASIIVQLFNVTIDNVGRGSFDADGIRVDERGPGDIRVTGMYVDVQRAGADGIELDEGQTGDVIVDLLHANFTSNGGYCDPTHLSEFLPDDAEDDFDEGTVTADAIPGPVAESPDDACFEREVFFYDDGSVEEYEFSIDVDDGFDIDEAGPGSIIATFSIGEMIGNYDEGYDFDEAGPGDIDVVFTAIVGNGNTDDAIKLSEAGGGNLYLSANALEATSNVGIGIVAEEDGIGDLSLTLVGVATSGNDGGDLGIEAVQEGAGTGIVYVIDSEIADGIETDGAAIDAD